VNSPAQANERLIREAGEARERAKQLPRGRERDVRLSKEVGRILCGVFCPTD
jgi:hypothetical protein